MSQETYDVLAIGRSSLDLYSNDIGVPFAEIKSFAAYVGGCPTNISVGTRRLGLMLLGLGPPDSFRLVFYRDNCADVELTIDDVLAAPVSTSRAVLVTGTGLSREPSRSATLYAAERAAAAGATVFLDIDYRTGLWLCGRGVGGGTPALPAAGGG